METQTVLENEFVTMWFHPGPKIVHHKFHKFLWGETFESALNTGLEVLRREGACRWLSDDRHAGALSKADTEWAMTNWFPRVMQAGWKRWAVVLPANVIGQMNMNRFIAEYASQGLMAQPFADPDLALRWLEAPNAEVASAQVAASALPGRSPRR
jgi:hypothetical protein